jgi:hypothetical protein
MGVEEIKDINLKELVNEVERVSGINPCEENRY